ncbi:hypothetical protein QQS21_012824 [Conoideocrella luteorostrata]|uniref:Uncharacterized protein n=1 Tax=Conoideocrella luteorostrata TaxID=1105319 RepID=A0AAJ0FSC2_9HYPO|nr:hypothetical protein QQS21_012824 [Conoideocrella luteorostrata]
MQMEATADADVDARSNITAAENSFQTTFLRTALCIATIHVHRPALAFTTTHAQFAKSLQICASSSARLIEMMSAGLIPTAERTDLTTTSTNSLQLQTLIICLLYPNGAHMLWQAGLTILFARWKGHHVADEGSSQKTDHEGLVRRCAATLRQIPSTSYEASVCITQSADVLETLCERTFSSVEAPVAMNIDQAQYNVWDWPMASALELVNTLDTTPLDFFLEPEPWL